MEGKEKKENDGWWTTLMVFMLFVGITIGILVTKYYYTSKMNDVVSMQRMVYDGRVYDVMLFEKK